MSRFSDQTLERVREAADFVEIVSAYTDLRRAGERFSGLCPFHEERTPSFSVDPREKLYYCFGCEAHGDLFTFVQEKEGLRFPEAVEALGERYGVEVEREAEDPRIEQARRRRERLSELLERTAGFYASFLWESPKAAKAREYLAGRGLGEEVLRAFTVGFAPSEWGTVLERGQRAGYSIEELTAAGLIQKGRKGGHYDRFRARIVFPVRDGRGRTLGFGARALRGDQKPKYLNSPEGELYRKSRTLFGIDRARSALARVGRAVVVEGYTDVLALHQAGLEEAVAVMGTAITPDQLGRLAGYTEEVVLALDADRAGRDAMLRAQRVAGSRKLRLRVAQMPAGEDPADMLAGSAGSAGDDAGNAEAAARFRALVDAAVDMPVFHVRSLLDAADLSTPAGRDRALDEAVPVLSGMGETISRDELAREVADRLDADPGLVMRRISGAGEQRSRQGAVVVGAGSRTSGAAGARGQEIAGEGRGAPPSRRASAAGEAIQLSMRERRERALLAMCVAAPAQGKGYLERLTPEHLSSPSVARARDWLLANIEEPMAGLPREDDELVSLITHVVMASQREPASPQAMELNFLQLEREVLESRIAAAHASGGEPPVDLQRRSAELADRIARGVG